jgi:hypothetical protein
MRIHGKNARFTDRPIISFSQALWLKNKLPSLRKIANKIFSRGLSSYRYDGVYDEQSHEIIKIYLSNISISEYFTIMLRTTYYFLKSFRDNRVSE